MITIHSNILSQCNICFNIFRTNNDCKILQYVFTIFVGKAIIVKLLQYFPCVQKNITIFIDFPPSL